jgi:hypothetical protein
MAPRAASVSQSEITKALKAAQAAGLTVFEYIATKQGVRVITADGAKGGAPASNPWDQVLDDGSPK